MRRVGLFLTILVLAALLLAACGEGETSTSMPATNVPPVTEEPVDETATSPATEPAGTLDLTTTPNVPVTGEESPNRLTNLMDYDVWNQNGEQIGEVDDMVLDLDNSNIAYVIVGTGGFLDIGEKDVLIPWNMLEVQTAAENTAIGANAFVFTGDEEFFRNYPDFDLDNILPGIGQPAAEWDADVRSYWSTGTAPETTDAATETPEGTAAAGVGVATATLAGSGQGTGQAQEMQGVMLASELLGSTIQVYGAAPGQDDGQETATASPDAAATPLTTGTADAMPADAAGVTPMDVMDVTVEDAIVDPATGEIQYLVVSGGFADGERLMPVPLSHLRWNDTGQNFSLGVNTFALENAPVFEEGLYPDLSTGDWEAEFIEYWNNLGADALVATPAP